MPTYRQNDAGYQATARRAAAKWGIPEDIFLRQIQQESAWDPNVINPDSGAVGLGQLMPDTAKDLGVDPHDPIQNIWGSARYLRQQYDRFGDWRQALAAYNAGPANVANGRAAGFPETQNYVNTIAGGGGGSMNLGVLPADMLSALAQRVQEAFKPVEQAGYESQAATDQARIDAGAAQRQLSDAQAEPTPEPSMADLLTRTLGNISEVLGNQGGGQRAEQFISSERAGTLQRRTERLKILADNAERLADNAQKMGLAEKELKYRMQADKAEKDIQATLEAFQQHNMNVRQADENASAERRNSANNASAERRNAASERAANLRAMVTQGFGTFNRDGEYIPNPVGTSKRPTQQQWSSAVERIHADSEGRSGNAKKNLIKERSLNQAPYNGMTRDQYGDWLEQQGFDRNNEKDKERAIKAEIRWFGEP